MQATSETPAGALKAMRRTYHVLQACCFASWCANVIFMIFGVVFMNELGVSLSGIFLLNLLVIIVTFFSSTILNKRSDLLNKRKAFMVLAFFLRSLGILVLALSSEVYMVIIYTVIINILNPISLDVAIIHELGEVIDQLTHEVEGTPVNPSAATRYYLKYRLFGSLGWAITAPVAGLLIGTINGALSSGNAFLGSVGGYRVFMLIAFTLYAAVTAVFSTIYDERMIARVKAALPPSIKDGTTSSGDPAVIDQANGRAGSRLLALLLAAIFLFQIGASLFQTPYALFMKTFSRGNLFYVGISYFCSAILEAPLFSVAYWMIKKRGYAFTLSFAFLVEIARVSLTVVAIPIGIPEIVLPLQMLNSFAFRWPALTHGVSVVSQKRRATGVNLNLVMEKAGGFCGSLMGTFASGGGDEIGTYNFLFAFSLVFLITDQIVFTSGSAVRGRSRAGRRH
ncbi:MAG: MFS transporter [Candidatus Lokiarchaeota archaeon]|nr:MFS transporter [Candidatus Lokiarchaeota archaeon]